MSENVVIPRTVWENIVHKIEFIEKAIKPLAKGYKQSDWMSAEEVKEYLKIGDSRLKQLRASGQFRLQKPIGGRNIKYLRGDIEDYQEGRIVIQNKKPVALTTGIQ
jgi:hypothetical protein